MKNHSLTSVQSILLFIFILHIFNINPIYSKTNKIDYIIINLGNANDTKYIRDWLYPLNSKDISDWAKSMGLLLKSDNMPVVDNKARFLSKFGSEIRVFNLKRNGKYTMWIDFVIFDNPDNIIIPSTLEILIDNHLLNTFTYGEIQGVMNPYIMKIPYDLTVDGQVSIIFREYSPAGGFWGIWDIILSHHEKLPERIKGHQVEKNKLRIIDRIIKNKRGLEKDKPRNMKRKKELKEKKIYTKTFIKQKKTNPLLKISTQEQQ